MNAVACLEVAGISPPTVNDVLRAADRAFSAGSMSEADYEAAYARLGPQRPSVPDRTSSSGLSRPKRERRRPRSPDRQRSLDRRRRLSSAGGMPPALASQFTEGERAALFVVAREIAEHGTCSLAVGRIAAEAGVGETVARGAVKAAAAAGLLHVQMRDRPRMRNLTNIVRIIDDAWLAWIRRGKLGDRVRNAEGHVQRDSYLEARVGRWPHEKGGIRPMQARSDGLGKAPGGPACAAWPPKAASASVHWLRGRSHLLNPSPEEVA